MAKTTIGSAYLAILPETTELFKSFGVIEKRMNREFSGIGKNLDRSLSRSMKNSENYAKRSGRVMGSGISRAISGSMGGVYRGITNGLTSSVRVASKGIHKTLKAVGTSAGVAIGGALAVSITSGLGRLTDIDQATSKLEGLGNTSSDITKIMENANKAVKGTSFGLGEAATVAASAVASGVKPGEDLAQVLTTIADTSAIAGLEMSNVGAIYNSVLARGKLQGDDLLQLTSQGVPVLKFLSKELGVTQSAVSEMVSAGEVDFKTFEKAMRSGLGGAAQATGNTVSGSMKNMRAAMGRFGATLAEPVFKNSPPIFGAIGSAFDSMEKSISPAMERLSEKMAPAVEDLADKIEKRLPGIVEKSIPRIRDGFSWIRDSFWVLRDSVFPVLQTIGEGFINAFTAVQPYIPNVLNLAKGVWTTIQPYIGNIQSAFQTVGEHATAAFTSIQPYIPTVQEAFGFLQDSIEGMVGALEPHLPTIKAWFEQISGYATQVGDALKGVFDPSQIIRTDSEGNDVTVGDTISSIFSTLENMVPALLELVPPLTDIVGQLAVAMSGVTVELWQAFITILESVLPLVLSTLEALKPVIQDVATFMGENPGVVTAMVTAFLGFKMVGAIAGPVGKAAGALGKLGKSLKGMGTNGLAFMTGDVIGADGKKTGEKRGNVGKRAGAALKGKGVKGGSKVIGKAAAKGIGTVAKGALRFLGPWGLAISLLLELVPLIIANWDTIVEKFQWAWEKIKAIGRWFGDIFKGIGRVFKEEWEKLKDNLSWFGEMGSIIWEGIKGIPDLFKNIFNRIVDIFSGIGDAIMKPINKAVDKVKNSWIGRQFGWDDVSNSPDIVTSPFSSSDIGRRSTPFGGVSKYSSGLDTLRTASAANNIMMMRTSPMVSPLQSVPEVVKNSNGNEKMVFNLESSTYTDRDVAGILDMTLSQLGIHDAQIKMLRNQNSKTAISYHTSMK